MEHQSGRRLWRVVGGLIQLLPHLPPLVRGRIMYSGALVLLGQRNAGLVKAAHSLQNRSARSGAIRGSESRVGRRATRRAPRSCCAGYHTPGSSQKLQCKTSQLRHPLSGHQWGGNSVEQCGVIHIKKQWWIGYGTSPASSPDTISPSCNPSTSLGVASY